VVRLQSQERNRDERSCCRCLEKVGDGNGLQRKKRRGLRWPCTQREEEGSFTETLEEKAKHDEGFPDRGGGKGVTWPIKTFSYQFDHDENRRAYAIKENRQI